MSVTSTDTEAQELPIREITDIDGAPMGSYEVVVEKANKKKTKAEKKAEEENKPPAPQGIVLYTDGGCRPNPGPGGWGIHGYLYRDEPPKKGAGQADHVLTHRGYVAKSKMVAAGATKEFREVTPVHYIDGFGSFGDPITNNVAEISATTAGLVHAADFDVKSVLILTDSEYVRKGLESWTVAWERQGWVKADGTEIANVQYWKRLVEARDNLRHRGVDVQIQWVKGHDDILGNEMADKLATIAVMTSRRGEAKHSIEVTAAEGYWKYDADKHPFLNLRFMYMNSNAAHNTIGEYYIGNTSNETDQIGKRVADGAFGLVRLEKPDPVVEMLRARQIAMAGMIDLLVLIRLEYLFRSDVHQRITTHGDVVMIQENPRKLDLVDLNQEPFTKELYPPKIAWRAVEAIAELSQKLDAFLAKDPGIVVTDLTSILYETSVKTDKKGVTTTSMKLRPEFSVGFASLPVEANYANGETIASASIILTLGIDMLDRNSLKRLEDKLPKVSLITWLEAPQAFRYATVVEAAGDKGIWAGVHSNLRIVQQ